MTANWAFGPVCGVDFWRVIVTSPEVLIFLFFMITDPKTVPAGRVGRVAFGFLVAVASMLLMAPQTNEFGTKVGLLAGLVVVCAARPLLDRLLPEPRSAADELRGVRPAWRRAVAPGAGLVRVALRVGLAVAPSSSLGAGDRGRRDAGSRAARARRGGDPERASRTRSTQPRCPAISVDAGDRRLRHLADRAGAQQLVVTLAENLDDREQALSKDDESMLAAVDHGDRLDEMRAGSTTRPPPGRRRRSATGSTASTMSLLAPFGRQTGLSVGARLARARSPRRRTTPSGTLPSRRRRRSPGRS